MLDLTSSAATAAVATTTSESSKVAYKVNGELTNGY